MLYELRIYAVPQGREADIRGRMLRDVPPLFAQHGFRQAGYWVAEAGPKLPAFLYLLEFDDAAHREAAWQSFYADPAWWKIRAATNNGAELVESYALLLLKPAPARPAAFSASSMPVHEVILQRVRIGEQSAVTAHLQTKLLPLLQDHGAHVSAVLDVVAGLDIPSVGLFLAWPDHAGRQAGWDAYEAAAASDIREIGPAAWRSVLLDRSVTLARTLTWLEGDASSA